MQLNQPKKNEILSQIEELALKLFQEGKQYARADIAYELKNTGIEGDSSLIDDLVHELFNSTKKIEIQEAIKKVFYNNSFTRSIVDNSDLKQFIKLGQLDQANELFEKQEKKVKELLISFSNEISILMKNAEDLVSPTNLLKTITGTYKIDNVKNKADSLYKDYSKIISGYSSAKQDVLNLIEDYSIIRAEIVKLYRQNVIRLTDVFGPKIKAVDPIIFELETIKYLQADKMFENIKLEFDTLMQSCKEIITLIDESIIEDLSQTSKLLGNNKDIKATIVLAGLAILKSQLKASEKATKLKQDLELMKHKMDTDASSIKADLFRLQYLYKTINEVSFPTAHVFQRKFNQVFNHELESIYESFYQTPNLKVLKEEKDILLKEANFLNSQVEDHKNQISSYQNRLEANRALLQEYREMYNKCLDQKPKKPNAVLTLFSLGAKRTTYHRDIDEWHRRNKPVIEAYLDIMDVVKIDREELEHHKKALQLREIQLRKYSSELESNSLAIFNSIGEDITLQKRISEHLIPIINLLRLGRKVAEVKIDDEHLEPVSFNQIDLDILPRGTMERLNDFSNSLKTKITNKFEKDSDKDANEEDERDGVYEIDENTTIVAANESTLQEVKESRILTVGGIQFSNEQALHLKKQIYDSALIVVDLIEETAKLKKIQTENAITRKLYDSKLEDLKEQFKLKVDVVNNRSQVLAQVIKTINTSQEELKIDALKELIEVEDDFWMDEKELIAAFKSGKSIHI